MRHEVTEDDTAVAFGSGDVTMLATPRLIAWLEAATVEAALPFLSDGQTSVGTAVRIAHTRPSSVGSSVRINVESPQTAVDSKLTFSVRATDGDGKIVGDGEIDRMIVNRKAFLAGS